MPRIREPSNLTEAKNRVRLKVPGLVPPVITVVLLAGLAMLAGCESSLEIEVTPTGVPEATSRSLDNPDGTSPYLLFNQRWIEGQSSQSLDLKDVEAVFWQVFSRLPEEVMVYPSENYYYFILGDVPLDTR